ncbi:MAG: anti-sigma factor [Opitutaceae bacterium]
MNREAKQELIALHALGATESKEKAEAEALIHSDDEMRVLFDEFRDSLGELTLGVEAIDPPASLRQRILENLPERSDLGETEDISPLVPFPASTTRTWIPWSLAACFAIICGLVLQNNMTLRNDLTALASTDNLNAIEVATLSSMMAVAPRAQAVAVWDAAHQEGVLTIANLPAVDSDKDYQLWIIDPRYENPVDGGVFSVSERGETRYRFKPNQPIETISAFAVSLERKGGVPKAEGPMVLISRI